jgi:UDP-N-acetylglucosamine 2-epimerase
MPRISIVLGTRPEIIKMASIIKYLESGNYDYDVIHTQQHYDASMSQTFFDELGLPAPDYYLSVGSGTQAQQTANAMVKLEEAYLEGKPDVVLVEGDTIQFLLARSLLQRWASRWVISRQAFVATIVGCQTRGVQPTSY